MNRTGRTEDASCKVSPKKSTGLKTSPSPNENAGVKPRRLLPSPKRRAPLPPNLFGHDIAEIKFTLSSDEEEEENEETKSHGDGTKSHGDGTKSHGDGDSDLLLKQRANDTTPYQRRSLPSVSKTAIRSNSVPTATSPCPVINPSSVTAKGDGLSPRERAYAAVSGSSLVDWQATKPVKLWSKDDVCIWCKEVELEGLFRYLPDLDGEDLVNFAEHGLGPLDIKDNGLQQRFTEELGKLTALTQQLGDSVNTKTDSVVQKPVPTTDAVTTGTRTFQIQRSVSDELQRVEENAVTSSDRDILRSNSSSGMSDRKTPECLSLQVRLWTNEMVLEWLQYRGLEKFKPIFKAKSIAGEQLVNIDMKLLDEMHINTTKEREEILSSIYQLVTTNSGLNNNLSRTNSGSSLVKVMPLTRSSSAEPPSTPDRSAPSSVRSSPRTPPVLDKSGIAKQDSGKKKKGGLSKLKEKMGPKIFGTRAKDAVDCVHIWNSLKAYDSMTMTPVKATESMTCTEVMHTLLDQYEITDDYNLYCLVESPVNPDDEVLDREMGKLECPLFVERHWSNPPGYRLELHKRRGGQIKVVYQISGMRQRGKSFSVSYASSCMDVLKSALRKIRLRHVDETLFCLMEINKENGDVTPVLDEDIVLNLTSDCFLLCDRVNRDSLCKNKDVAHNVASVVRRNSSLMSQGSTLSGNSIGSATSLTSSGSDSVRPRIEKLETLEAQMATIEVSITQRSQSPSEPLQSPSQSEDVRETEMSPREDPEMHEPQEITDIAHNDEKDKIIGTLQQDFQKLILKTKQLEGCQRQLNQAESLLEEREIEWQCKLESLKKQLAFSHHSGSWEILRLEMDVENARCEAEAKTQLIDKLRKDLQAEDATSKQSIASEEHLAKDFRLSAHESSLVRIKQKLISLQDELELAIRRQQKSPESLTLMMGGENRLSLCTLVLPPGDKVQLKTGCHGETVVDNVPKESASTLKENDRILEIDDKNAMVLTRNEVDAMLRTDRPVKLLVLRDGEPINDNDTEDVDSLRDDLSLALQDLESAQEDNTELLKDNDRLLKRSEKYEKDHKVLKEQSVTLNRKIKQWEERWGDLRCTLQDMKATDNHDLPALIDLPKPNGGSHKTRIKDHELSQMKNMLAQNASHIGRLQESLRAKELALQVLSKEKADALARLNKDESAALSYEELEVDVPLWISLKKSSKDSVLQALKDNILQNARQKAYLDRLLGVVIEQAPHLLEGIETEELEHEMEGSADDAAWC